MNKKVVSVGILFCFLFLILPVGEGFAHETPEVEVPTTEIADISLLAHVVAKGTGNVTTIGGNFLLGFGYCLAMIVDLEEDGHVELTSLLDPSDSGVVEGCQRLLIIGFVGLRMTFLEVNINGLVLFASSS